MKKEINKTIYTCDKCGEEITDVAYTLYCYANTVKSILPNMETAVQNVKQNTTTALCGEKHLCRKCKDSITDGVFIL